MLSNHKNLNEILQELKNADEIKNQINEIEKQLREEKPDSDKLREALIALQESINDISSNPHLVKRLQQWLDFSYHRLFFQRTYDEKYASHFNADFKEFLGLEKRDDDNDWSEIISKIKHSTVDELMLYRAILNEYLFQRAWAQYKLKNTILGREMINHELFDQEIFYLLKDEKSIYMDEKLGIIKIGDLDGFDPFDKAKIKNILKKRMEVSEDITAKFNSFEAFYNGLPTKAEEENQNNLEFAQKKEILDLDHDPFARQEENISATIESNEVNEADESEATQDVTAIKKEILDLDHDPFSARQEENISATIESNKVNEADESEATQDVTAMPWGKRFLYGLGGFFAVGGLAAITVASGGTAFLPSLVMSVGAGVLGGTTGGAFAGYIDQHKKTILTGIFLAGAIIGIGAATVFGFGIGGVAAASAFAAIGSTLGISTSATFGMAAIIGGLTTAITAITTVAVVGISRLYSWAAVDNRKEKKPSPSNNAGDDSTENEISQTLTLHKSSSASAISELHIPPTAISSSISDSPTASPVSDFSSPKSISPQHNKNNKNIEKKDEDEEKEGEDQTPPHHALN